MVTETPEIRPTLRLSGLIEQTDDVAPSDRDSDDSGLTIVADDGTCMICGLGGPIYQLKRTNGVFSNSFTSDNLTDDGDGVCYRCKYLAKKTEYRRYHWLATESGVEIIKERPRLIEALLDPPEGPWMLQYKDGSDFLKILNGWINAQTVNTSTDSYRILVDKKLVDIDRETFADQIAFARELRGREDRPSKRAMKGPVTPGDVSRYDIRREEYRRINTELTGREDWRIAVQLVE